MSHGRENVWVIKVERSCNYENLDDFLKEFKAMKVHVKESVTVSQDNKDTYLLEDNNEFYVNGQTVYHYPLTVQGMIDWEE